MATHQPIISNKTACVIGGTGFVASLLIKLLLEKGYAVKTTARDPGQSFFIYLTNSTYYIWLTCVFFNISHRSYAFGTPTKYNNACCNRKQLTTKDINRHTQMVWY